jgi:hypothetical protein
MLLLIHGSDDERVALLASFSRGRSRLGCLLGSSPSYRVCDSKVPACEDLIERSLYETLVLLRHGSLHTPVLAVFSFSY